MCDASPITLANEHVSMQWAPSGTGGVNHLAVPGSASWIDDAASSPLFAVYLGDRALTARSPGALLERVERQRNAGVEQVRAHFQYPADGLEIVHHVILYDDSGMLETWQTIRNMGVESIEITRLDSLALDLLPAPYELLSFSSAWGDEWSGVRVPLQDVPVLETRLGRSSNGRHPWFALFRPGGAILSASVAWSGNWIFRFARRDDGVIQLSGGLHDWSFAHTLGPGESMDSVPVVLALGTRGDLHSVSVQYGRVGRRHWYPHNSLSASLPVEWNHWWSYEDQHIDEQVFRANVDVAARLGMELCTLDAGWFGPSDPDARWQDYRGDYAGVNAARFPGGIRALSDYVHARGMSFGLWCEIEALGQHARLATQQPGFPATRDGERLGYVCFGNPAAQAWALDLLSQMIEDYRLDWIKLDFNVDPHDGCNRVDHGHGARDGLYAHYRGYYAVLDRLRARHPDVALENCASGGLRIDLGMLRHTVPTFLSDADWPAHGLQIIWGASTMLAPCAWLHWGFSEWIGAHPRQTFNPRDPRLQAHQLDYYVRIAMLGGFGLSQKLPELPDWVAARYAAHIDLYKTTLRRFIRAADFYRLTEQPFGDGRGERWAAFQYVLDGGIEHLVAVFRLPGGEPQRALRLYALDPDRSYTLSWLQSHRREARRGADLIADGFRCDDLAEEDSCLLLIQ